MQTLNQQQLTKIAEIIFLLIFIFGTLFATSNLFVEKELLSKVYIFIFFGLTLGAFSFFRNSQLIQWDRLAISIFVFVGYILIATIATDGRSLTVLTIVVFLLLLLYFKGCNMEDEYLKTIIVSLCLLQAIYGLLQYFQILRNTSIFPILGSFDNPAGFAACLAVAFPLAFPLLKQSKYYKLFAIVAMLVIGCAVVLSESRTGIVSIGVVSIIFLYSTYSEKLRKVRKYLIPAILIIGVAVFLFLLSINRDSASGRVLIWQNTWTMIQDAPVLGHGNGAFLASYMDYQANYFAENPESRFAMLADNVLHPFNEYLLLVAEYGLVGLALLLVVVFFLLKSKKIRSPYMLCLVALGVFSLFSYPLRYPLVWMVVAYCLGTISRKQEPIFTLSFRKWLKIPALVYLLVGIYFLAKDISFEYQWNRAAQSSLLGKTVEMMPEYERLHRRWNGNYLFLYNYSAELNHIGKHEKSNVILHQCLQYFNDYYVQMLLADNYFNLEQWDRAEYHYSRATNMCPVRFLPLFKLMNLYDAIGQYDKAIEMALKIIDKPVKVESMTVRRIKLEARRRVERQEVTEIGCEQTS